MPPIRKPEDPELRFLVHQPEAENMPAEMCQFTAAASARAAPPKARDLHASAAAVKAVPASLPGTSPAASRGSPPTPRATELAHLRAPATLAELTPRRAKSAVCASCDVGARSSRLGMRGWEKVWLGLAWLLADSAAGPDGRGGYLYPGRREPSPGSGPIGRGIGTCRRKSDRNPCRAAFPQLTQNEGGTDALSAPRRIRTFAPGSGGRVALHTGAPVSAFGSPPRSAQRLQPARGTRGLPRGRRWPCTPGTWSTRRRAQ